MSESTSMFLAACRRQPAPHTPVWFMRQAGRYMPEYRAVRARYASMLEMVKQPAVAAEITLQPIRAFPLDAAIIFSDILVIPEAMGLPLEFVQGEGPVFRTPIRAAADIERLRTCVPAESLAFTLEAIRLVAAELDGRLPVIGFCGAPFTLACYAIEGGSSREYLRAKALMHGDAAAWAMLMDKLTESAAAFLVAQAEAGASALQIFDSWAGALSPADYETFVLPWLKRLAAAVRKQTVAPLIYFGTGMAGLFPQIARIGADVVGVDWRVDLAAAWRALGQGVAVQGNLDPAMLFCEWPAIEAAADRILQSMRGRPGHIFNLGHGILEHTPVENVLRLAEHVRRASAAP